MENSNIFKRTNLADLIPAVWGERYNNYYKAKLLGANFFINRSDELAGGGDVLYTPNFSAFTLKNKSQQSEVDIQALTNTKVTLTVQTHKEISFVIEDIDAARVKTSYYAMNTYAQNAGYEVAEGLESAIFTLFGSLTNSVGASNADLEDSNILSAIATMETNKVPVYGGDTALFLHPKVFWNFQKSDKFSTNYNSPTQDPVSKEPMRSFYGIPVYVSSLVPVESGALIHKDAIHFATASLGSGGSKGAYVGSGGVRVQANYIQRLLGTLVTADIVYGTVLNRDTNGGVQLINKAIA